MDTTTPVAATAAIPSSTFSVSLVNAVLGMFLESCASIEEIANDNSLSIPVVMQCLDEQKPFLLAMLSTLELRVRLLTARAEAVAIESLREIAYIGRDPEARRKAASKLLSHFARSRAPASSTSARGTCVPPVATPSTAPGGADFQSVAASPLHAEDVAVSSGPLEERSGATAGSTPTNTVAG